MSLNNFVKISKDNEKYPEHSDDFAKLRKHWNITPEFYKEELSKTKSLVGAGKSGMKMWYSKSKYFFVKELNKGDREALRKLMPKYKKYMMRNKDSLLPKFYGIYEHKKIVYVVQKNLNPFNSGSWVYDLKGSHRKRTIIHHKQTDIGKDNNFGSSKLFIKHSRKIKNQMKRDTAFLKENNLMDYSLLVILRDDMNRSEDWLKSENKSYCCEMSGPGPSQRSKVNINIGIIDILQKYNIRKSIESVFKSKRHFIKSNRSASEVSAINSKSYKTRFDDYMEDIIGELRKKRQTKKKITLKRVSKSKKNKTRKVSIKKRNK